jgi:hypothetical protein
MERQDHEKKPLTSISSSLLDDQKMVPLLTATVCIIIVYSRIASCCCCCYYSKSVLLFIFRQILCSRKYEKVIVNIPGDAHTLIDVKSLDPFEKESVKET